MRSPLPWIVALALACSAGELRVGVAEIELDLPEGVPLAGYGSRLRLGVPDMDPDNHHVLHEPSTGVRDPITAQALVFTEGERTAALVCLDAIGVEGLLVEELEEAARERGVPLDEDGLWLAASHTHHGPGALSRRWIWQLAAVDRFDPEVHERVLTGLTDVLEAAWRGLRPARIGHGGVAVPGTTRNRRAGRSERTTGADVDPTLRMLRVDDATTGAPLAAVLNFAVHGTCLDDALMELSGDVPGAIRRAVSARLGIPVLFSQGALGDVSPSPGGERGMAELPPQLAEAAATLHARIETGDAALGLACVSHDFGGFRLHPGVGEGELEEGSLGLRLLRRLAALDPRLGPPWLDTRFRFAALRLGSLLWLGAPGEPIVELGGRLRALGTGAGYAETWVIGCCNGHMGYITTPEEYDEGGYEAWMTFYGRDTGPQVERALEEAIEALGGR